MHILIALKEKMDSHITPLYACFSYGSQCGHSSTSLCLTSSTPSPVRKVGALSDIAVYIIATKPLWQEQVVNITAFHLQPQFDTGIILFQLTAKSGIIIVFI